MSLYTINHDLKTKLWCGLAAIAAVTGRPTSVIRDLVREDRGEPSGAVMGMVNGELFRALRKLGYRCVADVDFRQARVPREKRPTLAAYTRSCANERPKIIEVTGHYVVVHGRRFIDSGTWLRHKGTVALKDAPHRRARVHAAWTIEPTAEPIQLPTPRAPQPRGALKAKALRLAREHNVDVEREGANYIVWGILGGASLSDPYVGDHYAQDSADLLERVETYIRLKAERATP